MKKKKILFGVALLALLATSCGGTTSDPTTTTSPTTGGTTSLEPTTSVDPTTQDPTTGTTSVPTPETYKIRVTAPVGIEYTISHQEATQGETVTLKITGTAPGFTVKKVTMNNAELVGTSGTYTFVMPDRSASVIIEANVDGEVTLIGEIAAVLTLNPETNIYEARNVAVTAAKSHVDFSFSVKKDGVSTVLSSTELDETKCFADITFTGSNSLGELSLASGCTYDFFYDPSAQFPCYVQRVSVDVLPTTTEGVFSLFDGFMRSETTVHPTNLNGIEYSVYDLNTALRMNYDFKIYENNVSYAKATNVLTEEDYHVYKEYDKENGLYKVVDTYLPSLGNNDYTRLDANFYGEHSATLEVVPLDEKWDPVSSSWVNGYTRYQIPERHAENFVKTSAHYGYYLERDFMYAYRVGSTADEVTAHETAIVPTLTDDGFTIAIDSFLEYDAYEGNYTREMHEGHIYDLDLSFNKAGGLKEVSFTETVFAKSQWDFDKHEPITGEKGTLTKKVDATYTYGDYHTGSPDFDETKYFIDEFENIQFYNPKTEAPDDGNSYVHYGDAVRLTRVDKETPLTNLKEVSFSPSTALDLWQWGPVESSNESVIAKMPNDLYGQMSAIGIGTSDVKFGNSVTDASYTVPIEVTATQKFHSVYIYDGYGNDPVDTASSATITAGQTVTYNVGVTPSTAPVEYEAQSEDPTLLKVVSTGKELVLDTSGAANITEPKTVRVKITSDWYDDAVTNKYTMLTFTIVPQDVSPVGTWVWDEYPTTNIVFTEEEYQGTAGIYTGVLTDVYQGKTDKFYFAWTFDDGELKASIYDVEITSMEGVFEPSGFVIDFYYEASSGKYGVCLYYLEYDAEYEGYYVYEIIGTVDDYGYPSAYAPFSKQG